MAQRRMFNKTVTNNDNFLEMPDSSQNLYFHLSMNADDDGFVDNWKSIMRMTGHKEDDLKVLILKNYVIPFESGVIVIRHWRLNNYLQKDRATPTTYANEKKLLRIDKNNVYTLDTDCIHSIDKSSIDKNNNSTTTTNTHACIQDNELIDDHEEELHVEELQTSDIYSYLERAWGRTLSSYEYTLLENWTNDEITRYAIKESVKCNARSIKYVETIVNALKAKGIKTEAEAIKESDNFKARKQKNCNNKVDDVFERYANSGGTDE